MSEKQPDLFSSEADQKAKVPLFSGDDSSKNLDLGEDGKTPLPHQLRPTNIHDFVGYEDLIKRYPFIKGNNFGSLVLWGPPGVGKTTLAKILSLNANADFYPFNAVLAGVAELRKLIEKIQNNSLSSPKKSVLFIDEIHRFNKAQQDALLPYVEAGEFILIGATTENPRSSLNRALLSRVKTLELRRLEIKDIKTVLNNALKKLDKKLPTELVTFMADHSHGDARLAIGHLELVLKNSSTDTSELKKVISENSREYDRSGDRHYDVISAFIKSLRGSDPNAALIWLAVMLDGGEDPVFIARRLVIFASEDVGNADPRALELAVAGLQAVSLIGMPEARINLAQVVTYLASTVKSNAAYSGINEALEYVRNRETLQVPNHLRNFPPPNSKEYMYPHSYPGHFVEQDYTNEKIPTFYRPTEHGIEKSLKERLLKLWKKYY
jgi:putative ATPase